MNLLDQNVPTTERQKLNRWRIRTSKIGVDIGWPGMDDEKHILPLLHSLKQPTFVTLDQGFYQRRFCHARYCIVHLDVSDYDVAEYVRRFLRHGHFNTKAKRMGKAVRVSSSNLRSWELRRKDEQQTEWPA